MKRRGQVKVALTETPAPGQQSLSGQLAQMAALEPPKTNAHDTEAETPCAVCGGATGRSELHWGPWRLHKACQRLRADPVARLQGAAQALGHHLERLDASLVPFAALPYAEAHPEPTWSTEPTRERLPWRHIDKAALYEAIEQLPVLRVEAGLIDNVCEDGPCAWCGVRESRGWSSYEHTWADGSPAPLCGGCGQVYERNGSPSPVYWDDQRAGIAEAATSSPTLMGEEVPTGIRAYAEGEGDGDGTPWSHLPTDALEAFRWDRWIRANGKYAPSEHRQEAQRRAQAVEAAWVAHNVARLAEEARQQDTYGFGVRL